MENEIFILSKMKTVFCIILYLFSISINSQWQNVIRINSQYSDKNPSFGVQPSFNYSRILYEFLVFQRISSEGSHIHTLKLSTDGIIDSVQKLSFLSNENINPAIDYFTCQCYIRRIRKAMAVWQSKNNGIWDIYGNIFTEAKGWGSDFPIVVNSSNKLNPKICAVDSNHFAMVYQTQEGDIYFKRYLNGQWLADSNLTANEPMFCANPFISYYRPDSLGYSVIVAYEKIISPSQTAIIFTKKKNSEPWTVHDTAALSGINKINSFISDYSGGSINLVFTSNRAGRKGIYRTLIDFNSSNKFQESFIYDPNYDNISYHGSFASVNLFSHLNPLGAYIKKSGSDAWIASNNQLVWHLGDSSSQSILTVGRGVFISPHDIRFWLVFSKDTLNSTALYIAGTTVNTLGINFSGSDVPTDFILYQNYPNPFNPNTTIKYGLAKDVIVKIKIYDIVGREVKVLADEYQRAGNYELRFDGRDLASGTYFYHIEAGDFKETKKMILAK